DAPLQLDQAASIQRRVTTCGGRRKTQPTVRDGLTTTKLQERGIKVDLKISDYCISFSLTYRDGGHHAITLGAALNSNRLEITENFTDDDGRNYTSLDGSSYDSANWKDEIYEEKLKKSIESFISYADRHGGI
ncbi:TPA: hypothetical protein VEM73_004365, partial [Pseudomonas aeruginosa]